MIILYNKNIKNSLINDYDVQVCHGVKVKIYFYVHFTRAYK